jgi:diacylglycerol kinase (ATP)
MERIKVILNPKAGRWYGDRIEPELRQHLKAEGIDFDLVRTTGPRHATELAQQSVADGFKIVVAAGGDGTAHEVVNGLMAAAGGEVAGTIGVIPVGTGSDFAHGVGIPPNLRESCHKLAHGQERIVDVVRFTVDGGPPEYFDNTLGIGFDGVVTLEALKFKRLRGMALYLPVVLKTVFLSLKVPRLTVQYDGEELTTPALMFVAANGPREGGGFFIAPDAKIDDGIIDLCITREVNRLGMLGLIPHFMKGTHVNRKPVTMARAKHVVITSPDALVAHADGEMICTEGHRIECEIVPKSLRVWC